jgi:OOP family OmpA-OmpF porin
MLLFVPSAFAGQTPGKFTLSPMLGGIVFEGDQQVDDDFAYGLGIGYNLSRNLAVEAAFFGANSEFDDGDDADLFNYRLDALYNLLPAARVVPYVAAGIGGYRLDGDDEFMANYGLGLLYQLTDAIALRGDVRHLLVTDESNLQHNLLYTAGLKFAFGGGKRAATAPAPAPSVTPPQPAQAQAVVAPPKDSDGDGVVDASDKCPGTLKGVKVDSSGCPLDSDGDGVYDHLDKCPGTPKGVTVDGNGCPPDSDGDGIYDYLDKCPDTPKGIAVDSQGCDLKMTLHINFDLNQAVIKPEFKDELKKAAVFIEVNKDIPYVLVAGHTDALGTDAYNQKLSERRAEAVRQYLIEKHGVDAARIRAKGYGESRPVADNDTREGRYQNRRVEIICCTILPE